MTEPVHLVLYSSQPHVKFACEPGLRYVWGGDPVDPEPGVHRSEDSRYTFDLDKATCEVSSHLCTGWFVKIYVASSWKNPYLDGVVAFLRNAGHEVYDFRDPPKDLVVQTAFRWSDLGEGDPKHWTLEEYRSALRKPLAASGFTSDKAGMDWADACVLVLPSGKSSHMEFGWFTGRGKPVVAYLPPISKPCDTCKGTGRVEVHPNQFSGEETDRVCWTCPGTGQTPLWDFSPELMYLLGGPNVLAFTLEEVLNNLGIPE